MFISKMNKKQNITAIFALTLTLCAQIAVLADPPQGGGDIAKSCCELFGPGGIGSNYDICVHEACKHLHPNWATSDAAGYQGCLNNAANVACVETPL